MFRKSYLTFISAVAIILAAQLAAYSQFAPVSGSVRLEKDGAITPVAGALIEVYRVDIKGGFPSTKTNKKGEFHFAGMPFGAIYVFSVSAPDCAPMLFPDVKAGQENLVIKVYPGDGKKYTEAEARAEAKNTPKSGGQENSGPTEEDKKAQAEIERKNAEIMSKNEKIKAGDEAASRADKEGRAALDAKNYDLAIAKFSEGIEAVPDFVGTTPVLLNRKIQALQGKGYQAYREGATATDSAAKTAKFADANKSFDDALASFQQALAIIKSAGAATDPADQKRRETITLNLYEAATEIHRLKLVTGDASKAAEAITVFNEYIAMQPDAGKKIAAHMSRGDAMRRAGDFEKAVGAYREVLTLKPDHAEAMGLLGLSLFGQGVAMSPEDKEMQQEGLNYMQKYIDTSPVSPTDTPQVAEMKKSIKESVDYLKSQKMAPQKVAAPKKK